MPVRPRSITTWLSATGAPPSISTIFRVLKARGFVALAPQKRPKSSFKRFVADLPNECWQADMTHVEFGGGAVYEVLNMIETIRGTRRMSLGA